MEDEIQQIANEQLELIRRIVAQANERSVSAAAKKDLQWAADMTMQVAKQHDVRRKLHMLTQGSMYLGKAKGRIEIVKEKRNDES